MSEVKKQKEEDSEQDSREKRQGLSPALILTRDIIVLVAFVFAFRAVVAEANYIPTRSMVPTLEQGDKIIVDKISLHFSDLNRGDIIIFYPPIPDSPQDIMNENSEPHAKVRFIKRLIGLPGETVEVVNGVGVFIDGKLLDEPYAESLPDYNFGPVTVPERHFFFLGDNRCESQDSHVWGMCPAENIIGRALFRYWPMPRIGSIEDKSYRAHYFADEIEN